LIKIFTIVKPTFEWTKHVPSRVFEYAFEDLTNSVSRFFKNVGQTRLGKSKVKVGFPDFISYFKADTFTLRDSIKIKPDRKRHGHKTAGTIELPKLPPVRIYGSTRRILAEIKQYHGQIKEATITKTQNQWFISITVERDVKVELKPLAVLLNSQSSGLDLGLKEYATLSDETVVHNPRFLRSGVRKLRRLAKAVSRSQRVRDKAYDLTGVKPNKSKRQIKKEAKLAKAHGSIANQRLTFIQQLAAQLIPQHLVLGVEDLAIANMIRNHCLAKSISDAGWRKFIQALQTRAADQGTLIIQANTFFASSQICYHCKFQNPLVKNLKIREWICPNCGAINQRDLNSAHNLAPTKTQIVKTYLAAKEKSQSYEKRKTQIAQRAKKAGQTNHQETARKQIKREQRASNKQNQPLENPILNLSMALSSPVPGLKIVTVAPIPEETLNQTWSFGKTGSASAERISTIQLTESLTDPRSEGQNYNPGESPPQRFCP
jgi:putative transposase